MWLENVIKCIKNILYSTWKYRFPQTLSVGGFWWGYGMKTKQFTHGLIPPLEPLPPWFLDHYTSLCLFLNKVHASIHVYPPTEMILWELLQSIRHIRGCLNLNINKVQSLSHWGRGSHSNEDICKVFKWHQISFFNN